MVNGFEYISNKNEIREEIKQLIEKYKMTLESLSKISGLDCDLLTKFMNGEINFHEIPILDGLFLSDTVTLLSDSLPNVSEDRRIQTVIESLIAMFEINYETIAIYAGIQLEELQSFMKDPNSISYEKKYKLATTSLFLHYLCKKPPKLIKEE